MGYYSDINGSIHGISEGSFDALDDELTDSLGDFEFFKESGEELGCINIFSYAKHYELNELLDKIVVHIQPGYGGELDWVGEDRESRSIIYLTKDKWVELPVQIIFPENPFKTEQGVAS